MNRYPDQDRTNTERQNIVIEGNTVRRLEAVPQRKDREETRREQERQRREAQEQQERQRREAEEREKKRKSRQAARANRDRAAQMGPRYVAFLSTAVLVMVGICLMYIQLQSSINIRMERIAILEGQVLDLKTENDTALMRLEEAVNLDEIRNKAINELGMVYPSQDQIIYYNVNDNDYMNQYRDIPEQ